MHCRSYWVEPNVFYELGRRHELGKPFIQLIWQ